MLGEREKIIKKESTSPPPPRPGQLANGNSYGIAKMEVWSSIERNYLRKLSKCSWEFTLLDM